jgi:molecular chaperone DnaK
MPPILPSVVAYMPNGETAVGLAARERRAIDAKNTIYSAKRVIGETWDSSRARDFAAHYPFDLIATGDRQVGFRTRAGIWTAVAVATEVLGALCRQTDRRPAEIAAVVTVPAAFGPAQIGATLDAARAAGFARVRCIVEPVATALAYLDRNSVHHGVVYDLGGGTFDLAIIDCSRDPIRIVAHAGDPYLGGDDVDHAIASFVADRILRERGWDLRSDPAVFTRLIMEAERAKLRLSDVTSTTIELERVDPAMPPDPRAIALDRATVWKLGAALIKRTFSICDEVLGGAGLTVRDIQAVFLAGGTTLLPGVRDAVAGYFGPKLRYELDPMLAVSLGASIAAARPRFASLLHES